MEGENGHPVFETEFGKVAINICYGRHHPLNWLMFGINGAEIVFNPSATVGALSEPLYQIEARCAAIANNYLQPVSIVLVRRHSQMPLHLEMVVQPITTSVISTVPHITAPNGARTPGLSRIKDGVLISEIDLNHCRQVKDVWGFQMTQRLEEYAVALTKAARPDFQQQIIKDTGK